MSVDVTGDRTPEAFADGTAAPHRMLHVELPDTGPCPGPAQLAEYIDGSAHAACSDSVERHLAACDACRSAVADARLAEFRAPSAHAASRWMQALRSHGATWGAIAAAALFAFVAGSASTWWMGSSDLSALPMSADVARLSPGGATTDSGPMSMTRGIILTPTQDAALSAIRERDAAEADELHERLEAITAAITQEIESGEPDRVRIGALVQERYEIMARRLRLEAGQVRDFCTMLTPDQCVRLGRSWLSRHGGRGRGGSGPRH